MGARNSKKAKISKYGLDTFYTQSRGLIKKSVIDIAEYQYPRSNRHNKYYDGFYAETISFLWGGIRMYKYTKRRRGPSGQIKYCLPKTRQEFSQIFYHYQKRKETE